MRRSFLKTAVLAEPVAMSSAQMAKFQILFSDNDEFPAGRIGEPEPLSYEELQRRLAWLIHGEADWPTRQIPKAVAKAGAWVQDKIPGVEEPFIKPWMIDLADDRYALDVTRAHALLGWQPQRNLYDTLPKMTAALEADPAAWYRLNKLEGAPPVAAAVTPAGREAGS